MTDLEAAKAEIQQILDTPGDWTPSQEARFRELRAEIKKAASSPPKYVTLHEDGTPLGIVEMAAIVESGKMTHAQFFQKQREEMQQVQMAPFDIPKDAPPHAWLQKTADEIMFLSKTQPAEFAKFSAQHPKALMGKISEGLVAEKYQGFTK